MPRVLVILLFSSLLFSCRENDGPTVCAVDDPVNGIPWIKQNIEELEKSNFLIYSYLVQSEYKGEPVFYFGSCCPFCKFAIVILDCQGNKLSSSISSSDLLNSKVIWKPANSVCNLD